MLVKLTMRKKSATLQVGRREYMITCFFLDSSILEKYRIVADRLWFL